jgi:hypothetical protein
MMDYEYKKKMEGIYKLNYIVSEIYHVLSIGFHTIFFVCEYQLGKLKWCCGWPHYHVGWQVVVLLSVSRIRISSRYWSSLRFRSVSGAFSHCCACVELLLLSSGLRKRGTFDQERWPRQKTFLPVKLYILASVPDPVLFYPLDPDPGYIFPGSGIMDPG